MKRKKNKAAANEAQMPQNTSSDSWEWCVQLHTLCTEQSFSPRKGVTEDDLLEWFQYGNIVTQRYLAALFRAIPVTAESKRPFFEHLYSRLFLAHVRALNERLCEMARAGAWMASEELWEQALKLSEAFSEMALKNPAPFKLKARKSMFMPSLRAKNPKFTADEKAIAESIELSAETVGDKLTDNRKRIGALCARLVGECVHEIKQARALWSWMFTPYNKAVIWPSKNDVAPYFGKTTDQLIAEIPKHIRGEIKSAEQQMAQHLRGFCLCDGCGTKRLHFLVLPELNAQTAKTWWKDAIEDMVEARFPVLLENPAWKSELGKISRGTQADMLKELKDYSRDKVKQFA